MRFVFTILFLCLPVPAQADMALDVTRAVRASWYDCKQNGECSQSKRTANGERFNPDGMTCAHRRYPFGTRMRVHYRNRSAVCRVNDRGPFIRGRHLDMAAGVARSLGFVGVHVVRIEVVR